VLVLIACALFGCKMEQSAYHLDRGSQLAEEGKYEEAIIEYHKARELNPDWAAPSVQAGHALRRLGRLEEAADEYRQALKVEPSNAEAEAGLEECLKGKAKASETE
jgi:Flp pilus assembly protein TadD